MSIEELEDKHFYISHQHKESHTKLSIKFAIEVLKSLRQYRTIGDCISVYIEEKIQELTQYLDDKS